jgi:ankyrin repeat protein
MFRLFFTTFLLFFCSIFCFGSFATESQTLEEITSELRVKKKAMEPFDSKKIKIDIESLGLDDLDKKPTEKNPEEKKSKEIPKKDLEEVKKDESQKEESSKIQDKAKEKLEKKTEEGLEFSSKIRNFVNKKNTKEGLEKEKENLKTDEKEEKLSPKNIEKKPTEKYINSIKKNNLKKRLQLEKQIKDNEEKRQEKLKKLNELREKYLLKTNKDFDLQNQSDLEGEEGDGEIKIVPQKKDINRFALEELPAPPILNRFRTPDNLHIPTIPTFAERLDALFEAVSSGDVNFFNGIYKNIENPDARNRSGDTILTYSILLKKHAIAASILAKEANPDLPNALGYTPIDIAIEMLDIKSIELLANNHANIHYFDGFGRTHLMHAARVGFLPAVEFFISRGVDVNSMDNDGFTALAIAYRHKKEVIVKFLLKNGAKTWIEKPYNPERESLIKELENHWR